MTPDQWQKAKELFLAAVDMPSAERAAFVARNDHGDVKVRRVVDGMLAGHDEPRDAATSTVDRAESLPSIGLYKLLQQIGEGGMGLVYMAEQQAPVRRIVALKLIKPGMDSAGVIARFEAERQALAMMDHPNIARVFDAGTSENGRPYFVMELVQGVPITRYCDDHQLNPRQRLELFISVCHAVQHAHQKGIIHRDLKPSNILITVCDGKPAPRIIDFGVAKALNQPLTEKTLFTRFGAAVGTLEYMSPEQTDLDVMGTDTRSDVYSLGVVLYELLTGSTPLDGKQLREAGYEQMLRTIRQQEPIKPSTRLGFSGNALASISALRKTEPQRLISLVAGDLDWIAMKCLEKERSRRYETANSLARDIERYLGDEPVEASPPSAIYRMRKLARRYRGPLRIAMSFAALLVLATLVSGWQAARARRWARDAVAAGAAATTAQRQTQLKLAEALVLRGDVGVLANRLDDALADYHQAKDLFRRLSADAWKADLGLWNIYRRYPPALNEVGGFQWWQHQWSGDGREILCGVANSSETLTLRDLADGHEIGSFHALPGAVIDRDRWTISKDGKRVLAAQSDGQLMLWEIPGAGAPLHLGGHTGGVFTVAISGDGRWALSGGADKLLKVWDLEAKRQVSSISFPQMRDISTAVLSRDGKTAAIIGFQVVLLELPQGKPIYQQSSTDRGIIVETTLRFTDDGRFALLLESERLTCFDLQARRITQTFSADKSEDGSTDWFRSLAVCHDGHTVVVLSAQQTKAFDCLSGRIISSRGSGGEPDEFQRSTVSPDGHRLLRVGRARLVLEDLETGNNSRDIRPIGAAPPWPSDAEWSDADVIGSSASPSTGGSEMLSQIWSSNPEPPPMHTAAKGATSLVISDDGQLIAGGGEKNVRVWDVYTGRELCHFTDSGQLTSLAFSPDDSSLLVARMKPDAAFNKMGDGTVTQWDLAERRQARRVQLPSPVLSRDGQRVVCIDARGFPNEPIKASVRDLQNGRELRAFSLPEILGEHPIISAEWRELLAGDWASVIPFSSDRRTIAVAFLRTIELFDQLTGRQTRELLLPSDCQALSISPDGHMLLSGVGSELWIWDVETGKKLYSLPGRSGKIDSVAFCRNGQTAAYGSADGRIEVLDFSRPARYQEFASRLDEARRALRANPKDGAALAAFGEWYAFRGKWNWAARYLDDARASGYAVSSTVLGRCYLALNNGDAARREFQQAIEHGEGPTTYLRICEAAAVVK